MLPELQILILTAVTISFLHTISGPDHYIPFIALSKTKKWSLRRTIGWTVVCGCGHVGTSVLLGTVGAALGWSAAKIDALQFIRGGLAGWALLGFGLIYSAWGLWQIDRGSKRHKHFDVSPGGNIYVFEHRHGEAVPPEERHAITPWVIFIIFLLGPCEPMMPLLFFPAAKNSLNNIILLVTIYTVFTLLGMVLMVIIGYYSISLLKPGKIERYSQVLGGISIFTCGAGMVFMEW